MRHPPDPVCLLVLCLSRSLHHGGDLRPLLDAQVAQIDFRWIVELTQGGDGRPPTAHGRALARLRQRGATAGRHRRVGRARVVAVRRQVLARLIPHGGGDRELRRIPIRKRDASAHQAAAGVTRPTRCLQKTKSPGFDFVFPAAAMMTTALGPTSGAQCPPSCDLMSPQTSPHTPGLHVVVGGCRRRVDAMQVSMLRALLSRRRSTKRTAHNITSY